MDVFREIKFPVKILKSASENLGLDILDVNALIELMFKDAGYDFNKVSKEELTMILSGEGIKSVDCIGFGCSELLTYYTVIDKQFDSYRTLCSVAAVLLLSISIYNGYSDWEMQFEKILKIIERVTSDVGYDVSMEILHYIFRELDDGDEWLT